LTLLVAETTPSYIAEEPEGRCGLSTGFWRSVQTRFKASILTRLDLWLVPLRGMAISLEKGLKNG
jgi:hypothetical protein